MRGLSSKRFLRAGLCTATATMVFIAMRSVESLPEWVNLLITVGIMFTVDTLLFRAMKSKRFKRIFYSTKSMDSDGDTQ